MLKLATIGTSWITEQFLEAAVGSNEYTAHAIYSRNIDTASEWAEKWDAPHAYDNLDEMLANPEIDVVYIASPNALHFEQAVQVLEAKKHAIIEKPLVTDVKDLDVLHEVAEKNDRLFFEAARHIHGEEFHSLKQKIDQLMVESKKPFLGGNFTFGQYSSRYDQYLEALAAGEKVPNVFSPQFAGGTMMDLSIYPLYLAVALFGLPEESKMFTVDGPNGVDLVNQIILRYETGELLNIFVSKSVHSLQKNELYFGDHTLVFDSVSEIGEVNLYDRNNEQLSSEYLPFDNPLSAEAKDFALVIKQPGSEESQKKYELWHKICREVHQLMNDLVENTNSVGKSM